LNLNLPTDISEESSHALVDDFRPDTMHIGLSHLENMTVSYRYPSLAKFCPSTYTVAKGLP